MRPLRSILIFLTYSHFFCRTVCKCWRKLAQDEKFTDEVIIRLLETVKLSPLENEEKQNSQRKTISIRPIAVRLFSYFIFLNELYF